MTKTFWDERFAENEYIYGTEPNAFFKSALDNLKPGKILLPAEGEGRNAVYAASKGWDVWAFDQSTEGQKKALNLAAQRGVTINYLVNDIEQFASEIKFDALALVYAHFHDSVRASYHHKLLSFLKPGGIMLLEAFHQRQMPLTSGGPKSTEMLYDEEKLNNDFKPFLETLTYTEGKYQINEGLYHKGMAEIIRFSGRKIG